MTETCRPALYRFSGRVVLRTISDVKAAPGRLPALVLLLAVALGVAVVVRWGRSHSVTTPIPIEGSADLKDTQALIAAVSALEHQEEAVTGTVWASELLARQCGTVIDRLWDSLNHASDPWEEVTRVSWPTLLLPSWGEVQEGPHGLRLQVSDGNGREITGQDWLERLKTLRAGGWELSRVEFRHLAFATNASGGPLDSTYGFSAYVENRGHQRRASLQGDLRIAWAQEPAADGTYAVARFDASDLICLEREGSIPFTEVLFETLVPPPKSHFIDPILLHDLDDDGRPEIVMAAQNQVYRWRANGEFAPTPLCQHDIGLIFTALFADADGDGVTDFLCVRREGLVLFRGAEGGSFDQPGEVVWMAPERIRYGQALTGADVDADGDLDLWLGQYKTPYERGQMPTPYYDANDGYPSYLLVNDGAGRFEDRTVTAGLAAKRHRRTYSASLTDLNGDMAPDLLVISDFAGVDLYLNQGQGTFVAARERFPEPHGFGMAHAFGDFDGDARLDLFVTGMHCPGATRLDALGLRRPGFESLDAMRPLMTRGNRLYLQRGERFETTELNRSIARSGWSWSPAAADFDNDGYLDVAIANGHETRHSVVDYEPEFWMSDIYVASSADDLTLAAYFGSKFARTRGQGQSYGGYEANRLFLNRQGKEFWDVGWLMGVAVGEDSRNAVAADLDADGRMDLVVTTFEAWPQARQTVRVLRNELSTAGHWIGLDLKGVPGALPLNAHVLVQSGEREQVRVITSGDLHRAQQPWSTLVGLGEDAGVERVAVRWPNGAVTELLNPAVDRYHSVMPPSPPPDAPGD